MYIGNKKINSSELDENTILVKLKDNTETKISKELFDIIATEEKGDGTIMDNINNYFAKKFVAELAYYNLDFYMVQNVAQAMGVLSHNLREGLIRKTFNCSGGDTIPLNKLIDNDENLRSHSA